MSHRSRLVFRDKSESGQQKAIDLTATPPWNSTLLQIVFNFGYGSDPTTSEDIIALRDSIAGPIYDFVVWTANPVEDQITQYAIRCSTELIKGDSIKVAYENTDDLDVGVELIFTEAW